MMTALLVLGGAAWVLLMLGLTLRCSHRHTTFPQRAPGAERSHITCLSCGKEIPYSVLDPKEHL